MKTGNHIRSAGLLAAASVFGLIHTRVWLPIYLELGGSSVESLVLQGGFLGNFLQSMLCVLALRILHGFHPSAARFFFFISIPTSIALASVPVFVNPHAWVRSVCTWFVLAVALPALAFALWGWIQNQLQASHPQKILWLVFYTSPVWGFGVWCLVAFQFAEGKLPPNQIFFFALYWVFALALALCMAVLGRSFARRFNRGSFWLFALAGGVVWALLQGLMFAPVETLYAARYAVKVTSGWSDTFSPASLQHAVYSFGRLFVPIHFLYSVVHRRALRKAA